jgi:2-C-methyl-D-erythritol 4-phosphate cytidylyltransferase
MVSSKRFADAIILAAGSSTRMSGCDKLFRVAAGLPLLAWTVRAAYASATVRRIMVVTRPDCVERIRHEPWFRESKASIVIGGPRRQDSVAAGVEAADGEVVLIHDGARPLVTPALFDRVAHAAQTYGAAVPVVAVPESMRRIVDGRIVEILDRTDLYRSQTPHAMRRPLLLDAYARHNPRASATIIDETVLVQSIGAEVCTVPGEAGNLKVTWPGDDQIVAALLEARENNLDAFSIASNVSHVDLTQVVANG